jgi:hypothetical protein
MTYMKMAQVLPDGKVINLDLVFRLSDKATIPFSEGNRDYVDYLAWLEAGNEPIDFDAKLLEGEV